MAKIAITLLFLCVACEHKELHLDTFAEIALGSPISQVMSIAGKPDNIKQIRPRVFEYEYIERITTPDAQITVLENHYFFLVKRGIVIDKRYNHDTYILYKNREYTYLNQTEF